MSSVVSKWVVPGIVTVVIGTVATLFFTQTNIETDLIERSSSAISAAGIEQAEISFSGRDGIVSGISTNPDALDALVTQLSGLHGVRSIASDITVAPTADPYPFKAVLGEDGTLALSGAVPSYAVRDAILERTGGTDAGLELMSGVPDGDWVATTSFAAAQLQGMSSGEASLSNLSLSLSGQARDADSYAASSAAMMGTLPGNIQLATSDIQPAMVENYLFSVDQIDGQTTLNGFAPDDATRSALATRAGADVTNNLKIATGAPEHFYEDALVAVSAARELGSGSAGYTMQGWFLSGQPATISAGDAAKNALITARTNANNWNIALDAAPDTVPYSWNVQKFNDGKIVISGNVPNEATRTTIMTRAGAGAIDNMVVANGAPDHFYEDALVGVSAIKELATGRAGHSTDGWFLNGQPTSVATGASASNSLIAARTIAADWNVNLMAAPDAVPYIWSASKGADGSITVSGNAPDEATRNAIMARAGAGATNNMIIANGAPNHFYEDALVGVSAIKELDEGRAGVGGGGWYLAGQPADMDTRASARSALLTARTHINNWNVSLAPAPDVVPFTWSAAKALDGTLTIKGNVPDEATRNAIITRAGVGAMDEMKIANGAPEHFYEDALVAVSAAKELEEGRAGHGGGGWYIFGSTTSNDARDAATSALITARTHADDWYVSIPEHEEVIVQEETTQEAATTQETATTQPSVTTPDITFEALLGEEGTIALSGMVPSNRSRTYLGQAAGGVLTSNLVVAPRGAPEDFAENARSGIRGLHRLIEGRMAYEEGIWSLSGKAIDADARSDALAQIGGLANAADWQSDIVLPTAFATCQVRVSDWALQSLIEFKTGSTQISSNSLEDLNNLAEYLNQCPESAIHVEGHTDSQGDFAPNLKLSTDRAQAVVDALVELGIDEDRLYSIGYGETRPIATNDTAEGRQTNRRIVFIVQE